MHWHRLPIALLLGSLLIAPLTAAVQGAKPRILLFAVKSDSGRVADLDPIAMSDGLHFDSLPNGNEDSVSERFRASYFARNRRYRTYAGGHPMGWIVTSGPGEVGCTGLPGRGRLEPAQTTAWAGLASNDTSLGGPFRRRSLSPEEKRVLSGFASTALEQAGAPHRLASSAEALKSWAYEGAGGASSMLVGSFVREASAAATDDTTLAVFLVAEKTGASYRTTLTWTHSGVEENRQVRNLVDAIDLDRDGYVEVVTETSYYESYNFQIYKRGKAGWALAYESTMWGC